MDSKVTYNVIAYSYCGVQDVSVLGRCAPIVIVYLFGRFSTFFISKSIFWYVVDANLFPLESANQRKKFPDPGCFSNVRTVYLLLFFFLVPNYYYYY